MSSFDLITCICTYSGHWCATKIFTRRWLWCYLASADSSVTGFSATSKTGLSIITCLYHMPFALTVVVIKLLINNHNISLGRRPAFFIYLLIESVFAIATAFAPTFGIWLACRIGVGFTVPAIMGTPFVMGTIHTYKDFFLSMSLQSSIIYCLMRVFESYWTGGSILADSRCITRQRGLLVHPLPVGCSGLAGSWLASNGTGHFSAFLSILLLLVVNTRENKFFYLNPNFL